MSGPDPEKQWVWMAEWIGLFTVFCLLIRHIIHRHTGNKVSFVHHKESATSMHSVVVGFLLMLVSTLTLLLTVLYIILYILDTTEQYYL